MYARFLTIGKLLLFVPVLYQNDLNSLCSPCNSFLGKLADGTQPTHPQIGQCLVLEISARGPEDRRKESRAGLSVIFSLGQNLPNSIFSAFSKSLSNSNCPVLWVDLKLEHIRTAQKAGHGDQDRGPIRTGSH